MLSLRVSASAVSTTLSFSSKRLGTTWSEPMPAPAMPMRMRSMAVSPMPRLARTIAFFYCDAAAARGGRRLSGLDEAERDRAPRLGRILERDDRVLGGIAHRCDRGLLALLHQRDLLVQHLAEQHDAAVGRAQHLDRAVGDRALGFPHRLVLHVEPVHLEVAVRQALVGQIFERPVLVLLHRPAARFPWPGAEPAA